MHLTSELIHPVTAQTLNALSAVAVSYCGWREFTRTKEQRCERALGTPPIILGFAAVFALQMLNIATPWGFSMHLMGAAVLTLWYGAGRSIGLMAGILAVQAIVLNDGDMGAWGTNVLSMGILPSIGMAGCLRYLNGTNATWDQIKCVFAGTMLTLVLTLGTLAATLAVPVAMDWLIGAHLVLGLAEAVITVLAFAVTTMPVSAQSPWPLRRIAVTMLSGALILGLMSISSAPDTLHWALEAAS